MDEDLTFELWSVFIGLTVIFGVLSNALTLISITYATIKKKNKFDRASWYSTTVFIFNLAFVDLVYCLFWLVYIFYGLGRSGLYGAWDTETEINDGVRATCKFFFLGVQCIAEIDGWSIAIIAVTRAFPFIR